MTVGGGSLPLTLTRPQAPLSHLHSERQDSGLNYRATVEG